MIHSKHRNRFILLVLAIIAVITITLSALPCSAYAEGSNEALANTEGAGTNTGGEGVGAGLQGSWYEINPSPGAFVNISDAKWNTTIRIDKPGIYVLQGKSSNVKVVIAPPENETIEVQLNGVTISPSITSNVGIRASAIEIIESKNSTVKLSSWTGTISTLGSYLLAPAIRKSGTQTKLILETVAKDNPGTIIARANSSSGSAGIGSVFYLATTDMSPIGNIEINSGNVIAEGDDYAAGIGGGARRNAANITINGGTVTATGEDGGAGIGGGLGGSGKNITINGGTVNATSNGGGAGIGSGCHPSTGSAWLNSAENIRITGGTVTAKSGSGNAAGIGSGEKGFAKGIYISGGTVRAEGSGSGSGIGSGNSDSGSTDIFISGGDITAIGGSSNGKTSAGIGGNFWTNYLNESSDKFGTSVPTNIVISGGVIDATGDAVGIGTVHPADSDQCVRNDTRITISGGTITAKSRSDGMEIGNKEQSDGCTTIISGGSINCGAKKVTNPVNMWNKNLSKTTVQLVDAADHTRITSIDLFGPEHADHTYGTKDVYTIGYRIYPWIYAGDSPTSYTGNAVTSAIDANNTIYTGRAIPDEGVLYKKANVTLDANVDNSSGSYQNGFAYARSYNKALQQLQPPTAPQNWTIIGYGTTPNPQDANARKVANADGTLIANVDGYTNENGAWIKDYNQAGHTLYTWWEQPSYQIAFNANMPDTASTQASGEMSSVEVNFDEEFTLSSCAYKLPGYEFIGWNTAADGTGTSYSDKQSVTNLAANGSETVTLYAQWEPLTYEITLNVGEDGEAQSSTISAKFDQPIKLSWDQSLSSGHIVGWNGLAFGSFYPYEGQVTNLCGLNDDGTLLNENITLNAVLAEDGIASLSVTNDNEGVTLDPAAITLSKDGVEQKPFDGSNGIYTTQQGTLEEGTYTVFIDGWDTRNATIEIDADGSGVCSLEYFTVHAVADDHASAWIVNPENENKTKSIEKCMAGDTLEIDATADTGYSFESWTAGGIAPDWGADTSQAKQTITLNGPVTLQAHPVANIYHIAFSANADDATGTMDTQDMVYNEPQNLFANQFTREGYDFAGWTTTEEWTSFDDTYADQARIEENLSSIQGETITLYAQWTPHSYFVQFNPNGADTVDPDTILDQKISYDVPTPLMSYTDLGLTLKGHHFTGWNTEADGSGTSYKDGNEVVNLTKEDGGQVTLYAQWERDYYTINYNANGGTGEMDPTQILTDLGGQLDPCEFIREGYTFTGWNTAANGSGTAFEPSALIGDNLAATGESITLYAQWEKTPDPTPNPPSSDPSDNQGDGHGSNTDALPDTSDKIRFVALPLILTAVIAGSLALVSYRSRKRQ